jgi:hypothetical protein
VSGKLLREASSDNEGSNDHEDKQTLLDGTNDDVPGDNRLLGAGAGAAAISLSGHFVDVP